MTFTRFTKKIIPTNINLSESLVHARHLYAILSKRQEVASLVVLPFGKTTHPKAHNVIPHPPNEKARYDGPPPRPKRATGLPLG